MKDGETQRNRWLAGRLASLHPDELAAVEAGLAGLEQMLSLNDGHDSTDSLGVGR
jgi:hypothetical protein